MATLVLTAAGSALGGPAGGAIGAFLGRQVDRSLRGTARGRPNDLRVQSSQYGETIPLVFGRMRVAGSIIWTGPLVRGSLGAKSGSRQSYSVSFALSVSSRPIGGVRRIWADGRLIRDGDGRKAVAFQLRVHSGDPDQTADPLLISALGRQNAPAFRDHAYLVFENFDLATFGNRIPQITVELVSVDEQVAPSRIVSEILDIGASGDGDSGCEGAATAGDSGREAADSFVRPLGIRFRHDGRRFAIGGMASAHVISAKDLLALDQVPGNEAADATSVSIAFFDSDRDFAGGEEVARVPGTDKSVRLAIPAAMTATSARRAAGAALLRARASREAVRLTLPLCLAHINVGDRIQSVSGVEIDLVVREKRVTPTAMTLVAAPDEKMPPTITALPAPEEAVLPGERVSVAIVENAIDGSAETADVLVVCDGPDRLTPVQVLAPGIEQDFEVRAMPGRIGTLLSPILPGRGHAFDEINSVEVRFENDPWLMSVADADLHAGMNTLSINGELIQFGRADPRGAGVYVLSRLLRECCDTRTEVAHPSGSAVVLLDPRSSERLSLPVQVIGADIVVRATGLDEVTVDASLSPLVGRSCRPWRPELRWVVRDGGFSAGWVRRSRLGREWLDFVDVAPPAGGERYLVSLTGGSGTMVQAEVTTAQVSWPAAALDELGPIPWRLEVREVGGRVASLPLVQHFG